jgi:hypothetical protein
MELPSDREFGRDFSPQVCRGPAVTQRLRPSPDSVRPSAHMIPQRDRRNKPLFSQKADMLWQITDSGGSLNDAWPPGESWSRAWGAVLPAHLPTRPETSLARRRLVHSGAPGLEASATRGRWQHWSTRNRPFALRRKRGHGKVRGGWEAIATPLTRRLSSYGCGLVPGGASGAGRSGRDSGTGGFAGRLHVQSVMV